MRVVLTKTLAHRRSLRCLSEILAHRLPLGSVRSDHRLHQAEYLRGARHGEVGEAQGLQRDPHKIEQVGIIPGQATLDKRAAVPTVKLCTVQGHQVLDPRA